MQKIPERFSSLLEEGPEGWAERWEAGMGAGYESELCHLPAA